MKLIPPKLALKVAKMIGWSIEPPKTDEKKYILIAAHHTSNWDGFYLLLLTSAMNIDIHWIVKKVWLKPPVGWLIKILGGIGVDRSKSTNFTHQIAKVFEENENMVIAIAPDGTRSKRDFWKTGFYYMAVQAKVPIALGYLDYKNNIGGIGPMVMPSGDIKADFKIFSDFYKDLQAKRPEKTSKVALREEEKK